MSYFVFATLGEMTVKDIIGECHAQGWVPVLVARAKEPAAPTLVPSFATKEQALKFGQRNLGKTHVFGVLTLTAEERARLEADWVAQRGWKIEYLDHPRLLKNTHQLDVEVFELLEKPDVFALRDWRGTNMKTLASVD